MHQKHITYHFCVLKSPRLAQPWSSGSGHYEWRSPTRAMAASSGLVNYSWIFIAESAIRKGDWLRRHVERRRDWLTACFKIKVRCTFCPLIQAFSIVLGKSIKQVSSCSHLCNIFSFKKKVKKGSKTVRLEYYFLIKNDFITRMI